MGIFNKIFGQKKDEKHKPKEANSLSTAPFASNNEENTNYETVCNNGKKAGAFDYVESVETVSKYVNMPTANEQNATTQTNKNDINPEPMKPLMMDQKVDPAVESNHFSATTQQEKNEQLQRFSRGKDFTDGVLEAIRLLIESGSDVNATDNDGFAPLHYLTCRESLDREENISPINKIEIIRMLVEAGADVNATDNDGFTPLHYLACQMNFSPEMFETMRLLIAAGADVNAEDGGAMYTPLFYFGEYL